jgi:tetratricopeptide (TPR) repeat protein
MTRLLILLIFLLLIFTPMSNAISIPIGEQAPDFSLSTPDGGTVSKGDFKDRTLILLFWRTGQERSDLSLKDTDEIVKKHKKQGVDVVCIIESSDDQALAAKKIKDEGISCPLLIDHDRRTYGDYGIRVYPTTVIINKEGAVAYDLPSHPLTYKVKLESYVRRLLGEINDEQLENALSPHKEKKDDATLEAMRLHNLALKFVKMRMIDQALNTAEKSVEAKPDLVEPLTLLGFLYIETDQAEKALETFNKAIKLDPQSNDVKTGLGGALVLNKEYDKAIKVLESATVANPYAQMTYYELGKAYEMKGDKDKSIEMYKKAIEKIVKKEILPSSISTCQ